ncbi:MAG TPA: bifunctional phosphoribosyl-AMP cyclohydrolase/phosphoribosyl-ATP diphosphatase HisIE [Gaiellales bacterium]|jgi:phosphoribosyl-ATP pyrophosphohydrolase/phosphoribosyl-AMP cyclohydrolase
MRPAGEGVTVAVGALLPCVVQDADTGRVLMLAYVDAEALEATRRTGLAHFHSRSRGRLWQKGETSGNVLHVVDIRTDCDADALLYLAHPAGPTCHTGAVSCFGDGAPLLAELRDVIAERAESGEADSYVAGLLTGERMRAQRKVGEEAVEVLVAEPGSENLVAEVADLWFHSMLLLARDGLDPLAPLHELRGRRNAPRRAG